MKAILVFLCLLVAASSCTGKHVKRVEAERERANQKLLEATKPLFVSEPDFNEWTLKSTNLMVNIKRACKLKNVPDSWWDISVNCRTKFLPSMVEAFFEKYPLYTDTVTVKTNDSDDKAIAFALLRTEAEFVSKEFYYAAFNNNVILETFLEKKKKINGYFDAMRERAAEKDSAERARALQAVAGALKSYNDSINQSNTNSSRNYNYQPAKVNPIKNIPVQNYSNFKLRTGSSGIVTPNTSYMNQTGASVVKCGTNQPIPNPGCRVTGCVNGVWEVSCSGSSTILCGPKPPTQAGCRITGCTNGSWKQACDATACGPKPVPYPTCRIGACVNGAWEEICN